MFLNRTIAVVVPALGYGFGLTFGDRFGMLFTPFVILAEGLPPSVGSEVLRHLGEGSLLAIIGFPLLLWGMRLARHDPAGSTAVAVVVGTSYVHSVVRSLVILARLAADPDRARWINLASYHSDPLVWIVPFFGVVAVVPILLWLLARVGQADRIAGELRHSVDGVRPPRAR